jgi:hypothetical protein
MIAATALALLLTAAPAPAPKATAPATPAAELARFALPEANWDRINEQTRAQVLQMLVTQLRAQPDLPAGFEEELTRQTTEMWKTLMPSYQELVDFQAGLIAKHYTPDEQRQLLAFYRSPLGQKSIRLQPEIMQDAMGWMQTILQQRMRPAMEKMQERMKTWMDEHRPASDGSPAEDD